MKALRTAWAWLKRWGWSVAVGLLVLIGGIFAWQRREKLLGAAKDEAAVAEALRQMDALRARRSEVSSRVDEKSEEITQLDGEIAATKRRIVELHQGGERLDDAALEDAFAELGY